MTAHHGGRVSPFGHPRINALLAAPRGLTQPHTSFIGPVCQGIHHVPLHKHTSTGHPNGRRQVNLLEQNTPHTPTPPAPTTGTATVIGAYGTQKNKDARVHYTVLTQHTTCPTTHQKHPTTPTKRQQTIPPAGGKSQMITETTMLSQTPNSVPTYPSTCS